MPRRLAVALVAAAAVAAAAPSAHAGRPGVWTRLSDPPTSSNIDRPSLTRTPDGILHVAWKRENAVDTGRDDLMHSAVRPGGALLGSQPVVANWSIIGRASIVADPAVGLRVLVGGQAGTPPGNTANQALSTATSADGGATWSLSPADVAGGAVLGNEGPTAAIVDPTGAVFSVFGSVRVHRGLVAPADSTTIPLFQPVCCGGYGNLAATSAGRSGSRGTPARTRRASAASSTRASTRVPVHSSGRGRGSRGRRHRLRPSPSPWLLCAARAHASWSVRRHRPASSR